MCTHIYSYHMRALITKTYYYSIISIGRIFRISKAIDPFNETFSLLL